MKYLGGVYRAIVSNNADPSNSKGLRLNIPQVFPSEDGGKTYPDTNWCFPACPSSSVALLSIPPNGSLVWVVFEAGDPNYPRWLT